MLVLAADITAFHVLGACLALWAVILSAIGVTRHDFPGKGAGTTIVIAISAVLVTGTVAAAIGTAKNEPKGKEEAAQPAPAPGGPAKTLLLSADPTGQLRFDKSTLSAPAGTVRIMMKNPAPVPHNVSLEGPGGLDEHGPTVQKGGTSEVEAPLKPGAYTYYCSVPGHREAGMEGTLTVK